MAADYAFENMQSQAESNKLARNDSVNFAIFSLFFLAVNFATATRQLIAGDGFTSTFLGQFSVPPKSSHQLRHSIPLGLMLVISSALAAWRVQLRLLSWHSFGLLICVVIPVGMYLLVKFSTYYSWMLYVPLALVCTIIAMVDWLD